MKDMGDATIKILGLLWNADSHLFYTRVNDITKNSIPYPYDFRLSMVNGANNCCGKNSYAKSLARFGRYEAQIFVKHGENIGKMYNRFSNDILTPRLIFKRFTITKIQIQHERVLRMLTMSVYVFIVPTNSVST